MWLWITSRAGGPSARRFSGSFGLPKQQALAGQTRDPVKYKTAQDQRGEGRGVLVKVIIERRAQSSVKAETLIVGWQRRREAWKLWDGPSSNEARAQLGLGSGTGLSRRHVCRFPRLV